MFVMGNLLEMVANVADFAIQALMLILLVNAVLSWFQPKPSHPIVDMLDRVSDFVCEPVRRLFPTAMGGIDFAPLLIMLLLQFVGRGFLVPTLRDLAFRLK